MSNEEKNKCLTKIDKALNDLGMENFLLEWYFKNSDLVEKLDKDLNSICHIAMTKVEAIRTRMERLKTLIGDKNV